MRQSCVIDGKIVPKGRPRFYMQNGHARAYTPEATATYENWVRMCWNAWHNTRFDDDAQLMVRIDAVFEMPKSASKKKQAQMLDGAVRPTKKPDCDNIAKTILDALNGIAYKDDSQVVQLTVYKCYGDQEQILLSITEV